MFARQKFGDVVDDVFDYGVCHGGRLAYWSELPEYLTFEITRGISKNDEYSAWAKDSVEATYIVHAIMENR